MGEMKRNDKAQISLSLHLYVKEYTLIWNPDYQYISL